MTRLFVILASAILLLAISRPCAAERVDRTAGDLEKAATDVFIGRVDKIVVTTERQDDYLERWHAVSATVERPEKGGLAPGEKITVRAWTRSWEGAGNPPPGGYGIRGIPSEGDLVRIYCERRAGGAIHVLDPNGFTALDAASSREVTFAGAGGLELHGTFAAPAMAKASVREARGSAKVPAVLLLPGSGPTDRDGNQKPAMVTDVLKQIAEALQAEGIATLRFDKRACPTAMGGWPRDPAALAAFFAYRPFIDDVIEAYRFMRAQPGVDPARCAILGHSEGGLFALQAAADLADTPERPAGVACLATPGRTMDHLIREQIAFNMRVQRASPEAFEATMAAVERGVAAVKADRRVPEDMPPGLRPLFNPASVELLHAYFTVDPRQLAAKVRGPVLVLNGDNDIQVSAELDAKSLASALEARVPKQPTTLAIVEGASHNLKATTSTGDPGFAGPIMTPALAAVTAWAKGLGRTP